ncbi:hypothetical protein ACVWY5_000312 [Bradyrhizobium sp. USDA 3256]
MGTILVTDHTGDTRQHFDPNDREQLAWANARFADRRDTKYDDRPGRRLSFGRWIPPLRRPCSTPDWSAADAMLTRLARSIPAGRA